MRHCTVEQTKAKAWLAQASRQGWLQATARAGRRDSEVSDRDWTGESGGLGREAAVAGGVDTPITPAQIDCGTCSKALVEGALQAQLALESMPSYADKEDAF